MRYVPVLFREGGWNGRILHLVALATAPTSLEQRTANPPFTGSIPVPASRSRRPRPALSACRGRCRGRPGYRACASRRKGGRVQVPGRAHLVPGAVHLCGAVERATPAHRVLLSYGLCDRVGAPRAGPRLCRANSDGPETGGVGEAERCGTRCHRADAVMRICRQMLREPTGMRASGVALGVQESRRAGEVGRPRSTPGPCPTVPRHGRGTVGHTMQEVEAHGLRIDLAVASVCAVPRARGGAASTCRHTRAHVGNGSRR